MPCWPAMFGTGSCSWATRPACFFDILGNLSSMYSRPRPPYACGREESYLLHHKAHLMLDRSASRLKSPKTNRGMHLVLRSTGAAAAAQHTIHQLTLTKAVLS